MHELKNLKPQNERGWSLIHKAQVYGFVIGVLGSSGIVFISMLFKESSGGGTPTITLLMLITELVSWPMDIIFQMFGLTYLITPPPSSDPSTPIKFILANVICAGLINGILLVCIGTGVGWFIKRHHNPKKI